MVSCSSIQYISFWNLNTYQKEGVIKGIYCSRQNHMIELPNNMIALSSPINDYLIIIINPNNYTIEKEIQEECFSFTCCSSLCMLNPHSFVYLYNNYFLQISIRDYSIMYKTNELKNLDGEYLVIPIEGGKYLVTTNITNGIAIIKPY